MASLGQTTASIRSRGVASSGNTAAEVNESAIHQKNMPSRASSLRKSYKFNDMAPLKPSSRPVEVKGEKVALGGVTQGEVKLLLLVTTIAFFVRTYKIGQPSSIV